MAFGVQPTLLSGGWSNTLYWGGQVAPAPTPYRPPNIVPPLQPFDAPPPTVTNTPATATQTPTGTVYTPQVPRALPPPAAQGIQQPGAPGAPVPKAAGWDPVAIGGLLVLGFILWRVFR